MAIYFIDSSALVKRYISETGSAWVLDLFDPTLNNEVFVAQLTPVEVIAAIALRARRGDISTTDAATKCNQFKNDLQRDYQVIEIAESVIIAGMILAETYGLRGYDAIQLAAGCTLKNLCIARSSSPPIFVSADGNLNKAASSKGLIVENPNKYP